MVETASFYDELHYEEENKPAVKVMLKTISRKKSEFCFAHIRK